MPLGEQLKQARLRKQMTTSQVAAETRMKVQTVEAIENESFDGIAAPVYAKGFIRLYAEHVGIDPKPLVDEYVARFIDTPPSPQPPADAVTPEPAPEPEPEPQLILDDRPAPEPAPRPVHKPKPSPRPAREPLDPFDDERDLFAALADDDPAPLGSLKAGGRAAAPAPPARAPADRLRMGTDALRQWGRAVRQRSREGLDRLGDALAAARRRSGQTLRQWQTDIRRIDVRHAHGRLAAVAIGVLALLILVASSVSRCARQPPATPSPPAEAPDTLILPTPPDLYLD